MLQLKSEKVKNLKTLCQVKYSKHERINSAWFPVHVVSKIGKFLQTESNIEVKRLEEEENRELLHGSKFWKY